MRNFFKRQKLVKQGLASGKTRKNLPTQSATGSAVQQGTVRTLLVVAFLAGLASLILRGAGPEPMKAFLIGVLILGVAVAYLWINHPATFGCNRRLALIFGVLLLQLAAVKLPAVLADAHMVSPVIVPLLIPFALGPLTLSVLLGRNLGLFAAIFGALWGGLLFGGIDPVFLVTGLITGFIAVFVTLQVRRRSRLVRAGVYVGLATWLLGFIFGRIGPVIWESPSLTDWGMIGWQSLAAVGMGIVTAMIVGGVLPMLETLFGLTTDISWLEMADLNHPLLRRMTLEAPGTYHHSLVVASLAEAAAEKVGANPTICRVCSYFHDVGKLVKPNYFTENMAAGRNPHDELAPSMSALIIIAHVKEGVDMALKHRLNRQIVDVIQQHHGNSLVSYFYRRALLHQQDAKTGGRIMNLREEDVPEVREDSFRYAGPRPQTRECGIIMLADAVESASRSLEKITPQRIEQLVGDVIDGKVADHQIDECDLTLRDLRKIAESFRFTLQTMLHTRIAYPKDEEPTEVPLRPPTSAPPVSAA